MEIRILRVGRDIEQIGDIFMLETRENSDFAENALRIARTFENTLDALDCDGLAGRFVNRGKNNAVGATTNDFDELVAVLGLALQSGRINIQARTIGHGDLRAEPLKLSIRFGKLSE
jgi:hypothetical protein